MGRSMLVGFLFCCCGLIGMEKRSWVFPWVANKDGEWGSRILIANHGGADADVALEAVRANGELASLSLTVPAGTSVGLDVDTAFAALGSGAGFAVFMTSKEPNLTGTVAVFSRNTASGNSPAAAGAIPLEQASDHILFTYMPTEPGTFGGAAIVNLEEEDQVVEIKAFQSGIPVGSTRVTVAGGRPYPALATDLAPGATGELTIEVRGSGKLLGMSFVFNALREPSMVKAADISVQEAGFAPLMDDDFPNHSAELVRLGKMLFFDKILSGNRNISCATCHHPLMATGDGLSLPVGEGGSGLGMTRTLGEGENTVEARVPRNAPGLFNLGATFFTTLFHDGRVAVNPAASTGFDSPAGDALLANLNSVLAVQALFPLTSATEMRGQRGENEVANLDDENFRGIWSLLLDRVLDIEEYVVLLVAAYPDLNVPVDVSMAHLANAIAAYEAETWRMDQSPFDRFLAGEREALSNEAFRGYGLFYGKAGCGECHAGVLQTDQEFHAIAMPQVGPGKGHGSQNDEDYGREAVSGDLGDRYRFRTPSLRNVAHTGPWGHDGAFTSLEAVVRHHLNAEQSLRNYDRSQFRVPARSDLEDFTVLDRGSALEAIAAANELPVQTLSDVEVARLLAFLRALSDPAVDDLQRDVPLAVPSGLPVFD